MVISWKDNKALSKRKTKLHAAGVGSTFTDSKGSRGILQCLSISRAHRDRYESSPSRSCCSCLEPQANKVNTKQTVRLGEVRWINQVYCGSENVLCFLKKKSHILYLHTSLILDKSPVEGKSKICADWKKKMVSNNLD